MAFCALGILHEGRHSPLIKRVVFRFWGVYRPLMPTRPGRASLSTSHGTRTIYSKSLSSSSSSSSSLSSSDSSANSSSSISACTRPLVGAGAAASASSSERASSSDSSSGFDSTTSFFFAGAFLAAAAFLAPVPFVPFYFVTDTGLVTNAIGLPACARRWRAHRATR